MISSIFYLMSIIILIVVFIGLKKSDEKQNLLQWICISLVLLFCYNSIVCFILNCFKIPLYLSILAIVNLIISFILYFCLLRKGSRSKYFVKKKDIIFLILFTILVVIISLLRFGFPFNIVYRTSDPALHYLTAHDFFNQSSLLNNVGDTTVLNFETRQFASYTNLGIIFKLFSPIISDFDFYNLYILFDIMMLLLAGFMFYFTISDMDKKIPFMIALIGTSIYTFAYPLNSMLIGFFYLSHSIIIINLLFLFMKMYSRKQIEKKWFISFLFLINLGLFFTYYYFVPVIFLSMFLYFVYSMKSSKKKIFCFKNIFIMFLIFFIPLLLGFLYFVLPNINNSNQNVITQLGLDGYCYIEFFDNFYLFIPILICYFWYLIKNRKINYELFCFVVLLFFMVIIWLLFCNGIASIYYLSKCFYLLWLVVLICVFSFIDIFYNKFRVLIIGYSVIICIVIISCIFIFSSKSDKLLFEDTYSMGSEANIFGIYSYNVNKYIVDNTVLINSSELADLKQVYNDGFRNVFSNLNSMSRLWLFSFFGSRRLNVPENQFYDFFYKHNYMYADKYSFDKSKNDIVLFYRNEIVNSFVYNDLDYLKKQCVECEFKFYDNFLVILNN